MLFTIKIMNKKSLRGQIQLSFGMIFSIIIIIATIAVAFYVISTFMDTSRCIDVENFYTRVEGQSIQPQIRYPKLFCTSLI